jgi:hypothetical protein
MKEAIDPRRIARIVLGLGLVAAVASWQMQGWSPPLPPDPRAGALSPRSGDGVATVTDIAQAGSRAFVQSHRDLMRRLQPDVEPLLERCRRPRDEWGLLYRSKEEGASFLLHVEADGHGAVATRWAIRPPQREAAPSAPAQFADAGGPTASLADARHVQIPARQWQAVSRALDDAPFLALPPVAVDARGLPRAGLPDGQAVTLESCVGGRYHLVAKETDGPGEAAFARVAAALLRAADAPDRPLLGYFDAVADSDRIER